MMKIVCNLALGRKLPPTNRVALGSVYWLPFLFMIRGNIAKPTL